MAIRSIGATHPIAPPRRARDARENDERESAIEFDDELRRREREAGGDAGSQDGSATGREASADSGTEETSDEQPTPPSAGHLDEYA